MTNARSTLIALLILLGLCAPAAAQGTISPTPYQTVLDSNGDPIVGACVWTYVAGTSTPVATYTNVGLSSANTNPIIADAAGRFTAFLTPGTSYKFQYETACTPPAHGTIFRTADNISAVPTSAGNVDVTGTAGETITAGQCVYLSDGSGSKNAGLWYTCDSSNTYSSTLPEIGVAPNAIANGDSGTIRLTGQVTGLVSLTVGAEYFVSTAGAITSAAPTNKRHVGHADSSTSLILTSNPQTPPIQSFVNDFRLSLATATCVTTADQTAKGTIYLTPCTGNRITLFNSTGSPETCTTAEISIAVPSATSQMYDIWAYDSTFGTCAVTLELLAWTNDTTRATALTRTNGRYTKTGDSTRLYLGSFRTTGSANQTEDSYAKRYLWNYYNRVERAMRVLETTDSWTYDGVFRQANNAAANQLDFVVGVSEDAVTANVVVSVSGNATGTPMYVGIGLDSTTTRATGQLGSASYTLNAGIGTTLGAAYKDAVAVGRHVLVWLESGGAATITWYGDNGGTGAQSGIHGTIIG